MEPDNDFTTTITNAVTLSVPQAGEQNSSPPQPPFNTPDPIAERPQLEIIDDDEAPVVLAMSEAEIAPEGKTHAASATIVNNNSTPALNIRNPSLTILPTSTNDDLITIADSPPTTPTGHGQPPPPPPPPSSVVGASASLNAARTASFSSSRAREVIIDREHRTLPTPSRSCPTCTIM